MKHLLFLFCVGATNPADAPKFTCTEAQALRVVDAGPLVAEDRGDCGRAFRRWYAEHPDAMTVGPGEMSAFTCADR